MFFFSGNIDTLIHTQPKPLPSAFCGRDVPWGAPHELLVDCCIYETRDSSLNLPFFSTWVFPVFWGVRWEVLQVFLSSRRFYYMFLRAVIYIHLFPSLQNFLLIFFLSFLLFFEKMELLNPDQTIGLDCRPYFARSCKIYEKITNIFTVFAFLLI